MEMDWNKVNVVVDKYGKQILSLSGVVGISTGIRQESGKAQPCIRVYLNKSVERGKLEEQKIPLKLDGVPVDILITGDITALDDHS